MGILYAFSLTENDLAFYEIVSSLNILFVFAASFVLLACAGLIVDLFKGIGYAFSDKADSAGRSYKAWKVFYISLIIFAVLESIIYFFITSYNLRFVGIAIVYKDAELPMNNLILNDVSAVIVQGFSLLYMVLLVIVYTMPIAFNLKNQKNYPDSLYPDYFPYLVSHIFMSD